MTPGWEDNTVVAQISNPRAFECCTLTQLAPRRSPLRERSYDL